MERDSTLTLDGMVPEKGGIWKSVARSERDALDCLEELRGDAMIAGGVATQT